MRVLVSRWAHTNARIHGSLLALAAAANALCDGSTGNSWGPTCSAGSLEVRVFEVPGFNATEGPNAHFPPYSRVNHAKYIVSDSRANIGTSNMAWGYFWNTAGTSFNSDHPLLRAAVQAVFERDWDSPYAHSLSSK
eukprot:COSAG01_NODE_1300_length_10830_cov_25.036716_8_plen_136_part_00